MLTINMFNHVCCCICPLTQWPDLSEKIFEKCHCWAPAIGWLYCVCVLLSSQTHSQSFLSQFFCIPVFVKAGDSRHANCFGLRKLIEGDGRTLQCLDFQTVRVMGRKMSRSKILSKRSKPYQSHILILHISVSHRCKKIVSVTNNVFLKRT